MAHDIYIVEDEPIIQAEICHYVKLAGYQVVGSSCRADDALEKIVHLQPDLVLVDIHLQAPPNGLWLAGRLRDKRIPFIFLTSHSDPNTLEEAKKLTPQAYILKPFTEDDLRTNIEIVFARLKHQSGERISPRSPKTSQNIFVKSKAGWDRVNTLDIDYLEACDNYIFIHITDKRLMVRTTLKSFLEKLSSNQMIRCHRSYAVNIDRVRSIYGSKVLLEKGMVPLGKQYRDLLLEHIILM
ncbi:MAG: response regulator [Bacteroidota bacterium]